MPNQLVTVDAKTLDFPQAVKNKLAEYFPTIDHANNIAMANASRYVNLNSSVTADADKLAKRDSNGLFEIQDATGAKHPVSLAQLDSRVPEGGYPVVSQLRNGLMSSVDKIKLDGATASYNSINNLVMRNADGNVHGNGFFVKPEGTQPNYANSITRKDYVDAQVATRAPSSHAHNASDINAGTLDPLRLPIVTATVNGAMLATDKSKLDKATPSATPNTLVSTDVNGRFQVVAPSATADVANKGYVDGKKWSGADITTGLVDPARIANATNALDGLMSKTDKALLDTATDNASINSIMKRDSNGNVRVRTVLTDAVQSTMTNALTRKDYVDEQVATRAPSTHNHSGDQITSGTIPVGVLPVVTSTTDGIMTSADKVKLDGATAVPEASNSIVRRTTGGHIQGMNFITEAPQPGAVNSLTRKDYVDAQIATRALSSHNHSGTQITSGTINPARIANATASIDGLMSMADKSKLDGAGYDAGASKLVMTNNLNQIKAGAFFVQAGETQSLYAHSLTRKDYVDGLIAQQVTLAGELGTADLNTITTPGDYYVSGGANATTTNNYPANGTVGTLSVRRFHATSVWVIQTLAVWNKNEVWVRSANSATGWTAWKLQATTDYVDAKTWSGSDITTGTINPARIANATASLDGLMSKADKSKLDKATPASTPNTLVLSDSAGRFQVPAPSTNVNDVVNKAYVDGKNWSGADITSGTINPARIANATASLDGLMSKADKSKLDDATVFKTANTIPLRNAQGNIEVGTPTNDNQAVSKGFVNGYEVLWTGAYYMQGAQSIDIPGGIMAQKTGIILVWGGYDNGSVANHSFTYDFIPKAHIELFTGYGVICTSVHSNNAGTPQIIVKYVYVSNTRITGNDANKDGIANLRVLRAIIGI
ncbi:minor tail protein [Brevibacterium phage Cantare]|uniref:Minor tail protein n=1 Tax=Brevibacterium phage Cantare TaxID=2338395 RepID=A0A3G3LZJ5_9CAUD|nr:tail fiber protein [Brevibacterium phage Cantare]AYQ99253.1 minor tail protein [Brevibacterium phage Cantare]